MVTLEIASPVAESVIHRFEPAKRPADLAGARIGLYWNYKPGGNDGLDRVEQVLSQRYPTATFLRVEGSSGATVRHVTPADADSIAQRCDVVIGTTGD
jgi:hypothetical protein